MLKRKCVTCRFFENNNIAGSGWCRHPDRVQLNNLVMVRKNELACRNTWDTDLWEPQAVGRRIAVEHHAASVLPAPFVPPDGATDRVTDISVPLIKRTVAPLTPPGTSLFGPIGASEDDEDVDAIAVLPWLKARGEQDVPLVPEPPAEDDLPQASVASTADPNPETPAILRPLIDLSLIPPAPIEERPKPVVPAPWVRDADRELGAPAARVTRATGAQPTEPLPDLSPDRAPTRGTSPLSASQAPTRREPPGNVLKVGSKPLTFDPPRVPRAGSQEPAPFERVSKVTGLPQCCGTCRDFRRNPDGRGGVCVNTYAFPEGAVVKSDELACGSSAVVWWLPHDDMVVSSADTAHHSRPTPFLDAALGQRAGGATGRDSRAW